MAEAPVNVLLVEDGPDDALLIQPLLGHVADQKFNVECYELLSEALERVSRGGIDVVLLDLSLPDSKGITTVMKVRAKASHVPIIVLTGLDDEMVGTQAVREGAQDYLVKGRVDSNLLARTVRYAMERHRLQAELERSKKMETVGRLAGGIAHDFNNLLTAIHGYALLSLDETSAGSKLNNNLLEIQRASERAANLTNQMLAFSRRQIIQAEVVNLSDLVEGLDVTLRRLFGDGIELNLELSGDLQPVKADPTQVEQVLTNLVLNARDAMPDGGEIAIRTANISGNMPGMAHREGEPLGAAPKGYVALTVSDTGVGMSSETIDRAFEPFFTTKEVGEGTGLGLAICYGIVQQSGGYMEVESVLGEGTTFTVCLPMSDEPYEVAQTKADEVGRACGTETVLLAEDEPLVQNLVVQVLEDRGYKVLKACNGAEALGVAKQHLGGEICLLLTDVVMPHMTGVELAQRIRVDNPNIKVIFMSGYTGDSIGNLAADGADMEFLPKPYRPEALAMKVREVLDK